MLLCWLLFHFVIANAIPTGHHLSFAGDTRQNGRKSGISVSKELDVCRARHCYEIATALLQNRNTSVDPCENFYEYACGLFEENNPIPDELPAWSVHSMKSTNLQKRIKDVLEEENTPTDIKPVRMVRQLYRSCMDKDARDKRGIKPLKKIVDEIGGWPAAMDRKAWHAKNISWQDVNEHYMSTLGINAFYAIGKVRDDDNTSYNILSIDDDFTLPSFVKHFMKELVKSYGNTYINVLQTIIQAFSKDNGCNKTKQQIFKDVKMMLKLQVKLDKMKNNEDSEGNVTRMTIGEMQEWYDGFSGAKPRMKINFLKDIGIRFKKANLSIDESEMVTYNQEYFINLAEILGKTPEIAIVNYVHWNAIYKSLPYTSSNMVNMLSTITNSIFNITKELPRWEQCISEIQMKDALSYLYVKKYFPDETIQAVLEMTQTLREELEIRINNAKWMPDDMKKAMIEKLWNIKLLIGYPEWYKNSTALIELYKGLEIGSDYFQNMLNCKQFEAIQWAKEFRRIVNRTEWYEYATTFNAFYVPATNAINIPAAFLQEPFYTQLMPDSVNYGYIGFTLGHELSHSFDSTGILLDKVGNDVENSTVEELDAYEERKLCFLNQFSNYTLDVTDDDDDLIQVDGELTLDENIADTTGIDIAFEAYKKAKEKSGKHLKLPGLEDIPDDQIFFLSFANSKCGAEMTLYTQTTANKDEHSPEKIRVLGSLSNTKSFSKVFNCPPAAPMNPQEKCSLWE